MCQELKNTITRNPNVPTVLMLSVNIGLVYTETEFCHNVTHQVALPYRKMWRHIQTTGPLKRLNQKS